MRRARPEGESAIIHSRERKLAGHVFSTASAVRPTAESLGA